MRIHVGLSPCLQVSDASGAQPVAAKPVGLWWANGVEWLAWSASELSDRVTPHIYRVDPGDGARLAVLESAEDLRVFTEAFGAASWAPNQWHMTYRIDWPRVAEQFDGIDLRELVAWAANAGGGRVGVKPMWIHGPQTWDIPSGCLWRPNPRTLLEPVPLETIRGWLTEMDEPIPPCLQSAQRSQRTVGRRAL